MRRPKKFESGEAAKYITRAQALKRLQLSLNDFRRLCIIKGIYPREPKHRRRAQKGSADIKILYHAKDIKFLLHEPIVWKLRDYKIFAKKSGRDKAIRDFRNLKRRLAHRPEMKIDHIVKERYPTFIDAIKDLDDCLNLLFLFSTFPSLKLIPREQSSLCRRLTIEFLHYCINAKALRKVFISIKGYYFQADIKGHKVTWIIPHYYPFRPQSKSEVDFKVMSIFVEFYSIMLGFVNFRLYHTMNLMYPPQFPHGLLQETEENMSNEDLFMSDRIAALNVDLLRNDRTTIEEEEEVDLDLELLEGNEENKKTVAKYKLEAQEVKRLKVLFKGLKFYINREVPREPLVVLIRSFGGKVSWDKTIFVGATYDETDESITHHIVDRQNIEKKYMSRDYIQPQWIFDSINQKKLLPTSKYFMGAVLPPHLSPFVDPERDAYIPPEEKELHDPSLIETRVQSSDDELSENEEEEQTNDNIEEQLENLYQLEQKDINNEDGSQSGDEEKDIEPDCSDKEAKDGKEEVEEDKETKRMKEKKQMAVATGKVHKENKRELHKNDVEEHRLQARMVKPRHRNLFRKLIREKQVKEKEEWLLRKKRRVHDVKEKTERKQKRKEERKKLLA